MKSISRAILKAKRELPDDCNIVIRISKDNLTVELEVHEEILSVEHTETLSTDVYNAIKQAKEYVE